MSAILPRFIEPTVLPLFLLLALLYCICRFEERHGEAITRAIRALTHAVFGVGLLLWSGKEGEGL